MNTSFFSFQSLIASVFLLLALVLGSSYTVSVYADEECTTTFCGSGLRGGLDIAKEEVRGTGITTSDSLTRTILGLINFALPYVGLAMFVGFVYGGFLYIFSAFSDQKDKAKEYMVNSIIGVVIIVLAYSIVSTILELGA